MERGASLIIFAVLLVILSSGAAATETASFSGTTSAATAARNLLEQSLSNRQPTKLGRQATEVLFGKYLTPGKVATGALTAYTLPNATTEEQVIKALQSLHVTPDHAKRMAPSILSKMKSRPTAVVAIAIAAGTGTVAAVETLNKEKYTDKDVEKSGWRNWRWGIAPAIVAGAVFLFLVVRGVLR